MMVQLYGLGPEGVPDMPQVRVAELIDVNRIIDTLKVFHGEMEFDFAKDVPRIMSILTYAINSPNWVVLTTDEIDCVLVGCCDESVFAPLKFAEEKVLWVHPSFRHRGLGTRLVAAFEAWAKIKECKKVAITAQSRKYLQQMSLWLTGMDYYECEVVFCKDI